MKYTCSTGRTNTYENILDIPYDDQKTNQVKGAHLYK